MQNFTPTLLSQFAQSPVINSLLDSFNAAVDPSTDIDGFYANIWNVDTATGYGLDVWGRIVGIGRVLAVATGSYFGFENAAASGASGDPFNISPFYIGQPLTGQEALSDDAFRVLILAKAAANICGGGIPEVNAVLMMLFGADGEAYVTDGQDMTMTYTFSFALSPVDYAIVERFVPFLTPAGVAATVVQA